ncbi:Membrane protein TerC, possibly involved in tellurium resistance [Salinibacterium xinjiangense]|uniref:Membrane protein TerC, possibly involved in tellurium resistance n=1 Tax=Salinibacterium xinjiangense TaxID=386302 RepID=A0A2C8Z482_9MICO|nr:TerC family protein [Salinibacterium xinjiangense]SOE58523.1 Membrane protein TerC, possibly involved in tellurium resistance [Salinibacterium xinjiangense]
MDLSLEFSPDLIVAFLTLFVLEIVLGIDNVIFISILASKLPAEQQAKARNLGLSLAMITRIGLLFVASWIISLTNDLFELFGMGFSGRDLILIVGGLFLIYKAVLEIHEKLEGGGEKGGNGKAVTFGAVIAQILLLDIVFSFDSVITAVGMVDSLLVIVVAVVLSFGVMLFSSKYIFAFVNKHPTVKMLALAFLVLIGVTLIADGFEVKIDKALIYVPIAFAIIVEALNLRYRSRQEKKSGTHVDPVKLRQPYTEAQDDDATAAATSSGPTDGPRGAIS